MASRKEQKDQAREARLAREQAAAEKAASARRIQIFGGAVAVAVVVIVVAVVLLAGGSSSKATTPTTGHLNSPAIKAVDKTVEAELQGIPQSGVTLGNPKAKVTMEYFGDLQCPVCAAFTKGTTYDGSSYVGGMPQLVKNQVRAGDIKVVYHSMCTATCNDYSNGQSIFDNQQIAAYAAGAQSKFWNFAETFYREQGTEGSGYVTPAFITDIAKQAPGLDQAKWTEDRKDPSYQEQVTADEQDASKEQLPGTPSLIMVGPSGKEQLVDGGSFASYSDLVSAYKSVL